MIDLLDNGIEWNKLIIFYLVEREKEAEKIMTMKDFQDLG